MMRKKQLLRQIDQLKTLILELKEENKGLKKKLNRHQEAEFLDRELLAIAEKINFIPLIVERYQPFRYHGHHEEYIDKGKDENGVQTIEVVRVEDYTEEKRWHDVVTFEENPREYLDEIRLRYLRERGNNK